MAAFMDTLEPREREELEALFQTVSYRAGEHLFEQGDVSEGAYMLEEGEIELTMLLPGGESVPVVRMGPGSFVGELAWLRDAHRTLSAKALTPVRAHYVDAADFRALLSSFSPAAFHLLSEVTRLVGRRVYQTETAAMELCRDRPPSRATRATEGDNAVPGPSDFDPRPYLGAFPLFESFSRLDREEFLERASVLEAARGTALARAGQSDAPCWIVVRGALEAICPRSRVRMALLGPGALFGHIERLLGREVLLDLRVRESAIVLELAPAICDALMLPRERLSYRALHGFSIATVEALERANRVLAREQKMRDEILHHHHLSLSGR